MLVFTSCTNNCIPKARVLASSLKEFHPDWIFCLVLGEEPPDSFDLKTEPFDQLLLFKQLNIPNYRQWLFRYRPKEACVAAKGYALLLFIGQGKHDKVIYFDADIMVSSPLDYVNKLLDEYDILLTPRIINAQLSFKSVKETELHAMRHGVFDLGFLGVAGRDEGSAFIRWWQDRMYCFCQTNGESGPMSDPKWVDLAPCFFERLHIIRDPGCGVAPWNLFERNIAQHGDETFFVNDTILKFFHFSGYDSGEGRLVPAYFEQGKADIHKLWDIYDAKVKRAGHEQFRCLPWRYSSFDDGSPVLQAMREEYGKRTDLQIAFPDPFLTANGNSSFQNWFKHTEEYRQSKNSNLTENLKTLLYHVCRWMYKHGGGHRAFFLLARRVLSSLYKSGIYGLSEDIINYARRPR